MMHLHYILSLHIGYSYLFPYPANIIRKVKSNFVVAGLGYNCG